MEIELRFRRGLVWTVNLAVEIKPRFQINANIRLFRRKRCHTTGQKVTRDNAIGIIGSYSLVLLN